MDTIDPNAVLRGETNVKPGDAFLTECEKQEKFVAMRFDPQVPEPDKAYKHFKVLAVGMRQKCETEITNARH